jgi:pyridoxal 5'-phosphate synthase pdxT subunit
MSQIGILALQGGVQPHVAMLRQLGCDPALVTKPDQLKSLDRLIIPGGESTALLKLMRPWNFLLAIQQFARNGKVILGTCAGCILLANDLNPQQDSVGVIDISVTRNAYGSQLDSFTDQTSDLSSALGVESLPLVFIRAPKIHRVGAKVTVLAQHEGDAVLVQQDNILCATFHPELSGNAAVHQFFLTL